MMRVAYVCADPGVPIFGCKGCSVHVQEMVRALTELGCDVQVFATRLGGAPPEALQGVRVTCLRMPDGKGGARERSALAANRSLRDALNAAGQFDLFYERYSLWSHAALECADQRGVPSVLEVNAPLVDEQQEHRGLLHVGVARDVERRAFCLARVVVGVSEEVCAYVRTIQRLPHRVHCVPNGVDPTRFARVAPSRHVAGALTVGFLGTLKPWHGLDVLMESFDRLARRVARARLLVVGDGPLREPLHAEAARRGLASKIEFTGAVSPARVPGLLASFDVATAPYARREGFYFSPLKLFEYMAAARAIAASRVGQVEALLEEGRAGVLVPPGNPYLLAERLEELLRDPDARRNLGAAARRIVQRHYTWTAVATTILRLVGYAPLSRRKRTAVAG